MHAAPPERRLDPSSDIDPQGSTTDLAVVKVDGRDFPLLAFETEAPPRVGDWVATKGGREADTLETVQALLDRIEAGGGRI